MIFDLSSAHLGDVLMAMPAMRSTDAVMAKPQHRVPGAPVAWMEPKEGKATVWPASRRGRHTTDAWLESTGRGPVRHRLMPEVGRSGVLLAPAVAAESKRWHLWTELVAALDDDPALITSEHSRADWMAALNQAETVICPDTGTAHMADALGCPRVIALHGIPSNWPHCAPYWDRSHCIARNSMDAITVEDVLEVVRG